MRLEYMIDRNSIRRLAEVSASNDARKSVAARIEAYRAQGFNAWPSAMYRRALHVKCYGCEITYAHGQPTHAAGCKKGS